MKKNYPILFIFIAFIFSSCTKMSFRDAGGSTGGTIDPSGGSTYFLDNGIPYGTVESTISSNFNGTAIAAGNDIWFNAHLKISGTVDAGTIIIVDNSNVTFAGSTTSLPNSVISFSNTTASAPVYDAAKNVWNITALVTEKGNIFFTGLIFDSPGLPGGINPVNFHSSFSTNTPGITMQWQWSAAVFNTNMSYSNLNVVGFEGSGNQPGAPLGYKGYAIGGARGGGASNLTGSWSGTGSVKPGW